jgi:hypothetical protein
MNIQLRCRDGLNPAHFVSIGLKFALDPAQRAPVITERFKVPKHG